MPIRYVDQRSVVGRMESALGSFSSAVAGTHEAPPDRTGIVSASMQPFTCAMPGIFQAAANRTGTVAATLGNFAPNLQGTFTPSTVDSFPRKAYYGIGHTAPGRRYDSEAFLNAAPSFRFIIGAIWPAWFVGKTYDFTEVCQEIHTRSNGRTEVILYQIYESIHKSAANVGDAQRSLYDLINNNGLWAFANALTETGQVDSYNSAYFQNNHSTAGKLVGGKRQYQLTVDWYLSWEVNGATVNGVAHPPNTALDGDFFDNLFPYFKNPPADMNRDGSVDNYSSAASITLAQNSHVAAIDYIRSLRPGKRLLGNTAEWIFAGSIASYIGKLDGGVIEGGIGQSYSHETSVNFKAYIDYIHFNVNAYADPKWGLVVNILDSLTNYALMRYGYAATALTNGYCHHSTSSLSCDDMATVAAFDEYRFDLGQPVAGPDGAPQTTARYFPAADGSGVWRRDFTNGIVLCAARRGTGAVGASSTAAYGAIALGATFYRLGAPLDPVWNNGAAITSITMIPRTGIVLSRTPYDRIPPTIPGSFAAAAMTASSISLSWTASTDTGGSNLAGYKIERSLTGTGGWSEITQTTGTSYPSTGLSASTQYFYRARAYDNAGNHSGYTAVVSATTHATTTSVLFTEEWWSGDKTRTMNGVRWHGTGANATVVADPGNHTGFALRLRHPALAQFNSEQRFYLGPESAGGIYRDLYGKYRLFIPANWTTPTGIPGNGGVNNKFFRLWSRGPDFPVNDGYTPYYFKGGFSGVATASGATNFRSERGSDHYGVGAAGTGESRSVLITPADRGTEVTFHFRVKTDTIGAINQPHTPPRTGNAILQLWKNGVRICNDTGLNWRSSDGLHEYFEYGYVWGYCNSGFTQVSDLLMREFTLSTTSIDGVS
jgi:hypothetical protein